MRAGQERVMRWVGPLLAGVAVAAMVGFGLALPGYLPGAHPLALLGARGVPHAGTFNLLVFLLPGGLAMALALRLLQRAGRAAAWPLRVGAHALLLAGLAFAGMGLLPLDPSQLQSRANQWHASAWLLWVVALIAAAGLLGLGARHDPAARGWAALALALAPLVALAAFALDRLLAPALAQRLVFLLWWGWLALLARWPGAQARMGHG